MNFLINFYSYSHGEVQNIYMSVVVSNDVKGKKNRSKYSIALYRMIVKTSMCGIARQDLSFDTPHHLLTHFGDKEMQIRFSPQLRACCS